MKHLIFVAGLALALALPGYAAEDKKPETKTGQRWKAGDRS